MDPASEVQAHIYFSSCVPPLSVVGWYHSHPTFDPSPSLRDIETQSAHQTLFRCSSSNINSGGGFGDGFVEPFVGAIVAPFDLAWKETASRIVWMQVVDSLSAVSVSTYRKLFLKFIFYI
jgi:hypothetical protein